MKCTAINGFLSSLTMPCKTPAFPSTDCKKICHAVFVELDAFHRRYSGQLVIFRCKHCQALPAGIW